MSRLLRNAQIQSPIKKDSANVDKPKRPRSSLDKTENVASNKRARTSDPELERKPRARQQRVTSEESICEESSDDVKASTASRKLNKRKRSSVIAHERFASMASIMPSAVTPAETSSDETSSRGTLDAFIPVPKNFDGLNNPFCNLSPNYGSISRSASYSCVRPLKTRLSEKDIRITKNGEVRRKRFVRKWKRGSQPDLASALFHMDAAFSFGGAPQNYRNSKESVMSYFGVEERVSRGEKYTVQARRVLPKGHTQYLIQWEGAESVVA